MNNPFAHLTSATMQLPVYYDDLTPIQRRIVREEYTKRQHGKCHYCQAPLGGEPIDRIRTAYIDLTRFPPGMLNHPVHLHHSRETGKTIGAVHARCNAYLWQYEGE